MKIGLIADPGESISADIKLQLRRTLRAAARRFPDRAQALTVRFIGAEAMRQLNATWRAKDRPTDVLSFPVDAQTETRSQYLGDVAICLAVAQRQARRRRHSLTREVALLGLHGYLHLLGFDHERDQGEMNQLERELRRTVLPAGVA